MANFRLLSAVFAAELQKSIANFLSRLFRRHDIPEICFWQQFA
jgi:hypothetical protein